MSHRFFCSFRAQGNVGEGIVVELSCEKEANAVASLLSALYLKSSLKNKLKQNHCERFFFIFKLQTQRMKETIEVSYINIKFNFRFQLLTS